MRQEQTTPIALVIGTRPNVMKAAPLCRALSRMQISYTLIHTGQHYDLHMSTDFFAAFDIEPQVVYTLWHKSPSAQIGEIMQNLEKTFEELLPSQVVVFGDVNTTLAAALVSTKMHIPVSHVEAGLRSHNRAMSEEINRIAVDHIADVLFAPSEEAATQLKREGIQQPIHVVGNIMVDLLIEEADSAENSSEHFYFCTLHRAENVDDEKTFSGIIKALQKIGQETKIYFSLHPRTKKRAEQFGLMQEVEKIGTILPPLSYKDTVHYMKNAQLVLTDSGGIQEETTVLGTPCLTLRDETERPITVTAGTNRIAGTGYESILKAYQALLPLKRKKVQIPLWDGKTAERVAQILIKG